MMRRETGDPHFPIWLIGDSNPSQWESDLQTPFDPRHPIIHNIWTSIIDILQDKVYRAKKLRIDMSNAYIRNAVDDPLKKPKSSDIQWSGAVLDEITNLEKLVRKFHPIILFSFGSFSYEFTRRALGKQDQKFGSWGSKRLGNEFYLQIDTFKINGTNTIPLLHRSISGGKYLKSYENFTGNKSGNYFEFVAENLAKLVLKYEDQFNIWII